MGCGGGSGGWGERRGGGEGGRSVGVIVGRWWTVGIFRGRWETGL